MTVDCLHQELKIGDYVVFNPPYVKGLEYGKITKLTPKGVTVKYGTGEKFKPSECNRRSAEVVRITEQMIVAKNENPEQFI